MLSSLLYLIAEIVVFLLGLGTLGFAAIAVHEAGHAAVGLLCGFRIHGVRVGPIEAKKEKEWDWSLRKRSLIGGLVAAQFREPPGRWAGWQCFAFLIAGPMTNLLVALVLAPLSSSPTFAGAASGWFVVVSIFVGVVNLVPFNTPDGRTDGAKLISLLFSKTKRDELIFELSVMTRIAEVKALWQNQRLREARDKVNELITRLTTIPGTNDIEVISHFTKFRNILDSALAGTREPISETATIES